MQFRADVVTGSGKGKTLGTPTINLNTDQVPNSINDGVYACFVRLGKTGPRLPAAVHIGKRETVDNQRTCEVHVIDHIVTLPPLAVEVDAVSRLRGVQKFGSIDKLKKQLKTDISQARAMLVSCSVQ